MNGYSSHHLDEGDFGPKDGLSQGLRTFDAFPKTKTSYTVRNERGGQWTVLLLCLCTALSLSELRAWYRGHEAHHFTVEKGISHQMQINLDIVVAMRCEDLHVNVQDAAGDRIMAGDLLRRDQTNWHQWVDGKGVHLLGRDAQGRVNTGEGEEEEHVKDVLAATRKRTFNKTPRLRGPDTSCRLYGSLDLNKVQGDFHLTARGHGYMQYGDHLDHSQFNFSHVINELSFGPFYPSLHNPLDRTRATTDAHFFKFQYYLSVVPTIFTSSSSQTPSTASSDTIITNQYAVTEQSYDVGERSIPGIFFKFDIEPILLTVSAKRGGLLALLVRLVNVVSGILVGGGWCYQLVGWAGELWGRRSRRASFGGGVLGNRREKHDD